MIRLMCKWLAVMTFLLGSAIGYASRPSAFVLTDPHGDDAGPGTTTYPSESLYIDGIFDLTEFSVGQLEKGHYEIALQFRTIPIIHRDVHLDQSVTLGELCPQPPCLQTVDIYFRTPAAEKGIPHALPGRNVDIGRDQGWNKCVLLTPDPAAARSQLKALLRKKQVVLDTDASVSSRLMDAYFYFPPRVDLVGRSLKFDLPAAWLQSPIEECGIAVIVSCTELIPTSKVMNRLFGNQTMPFRIMVPGPMATEWEPGGSDGSGSYPAYLDVLAPSNVDYQQPARGAGSGLEIVPFVYVQTPKLAGIRGTSVEVNAPAPPLDDVNRAENAQIIEISDAQDDEITALADADVSLVIGDLVEVVDRDHHKIGNAVVVNVFMVSADSGRSEKVIVVKYSSGPKPSEIQPAFLHIPINPR